TPSPGFARTRGEFVRCIARIGHRTRRRDMRFCSARALRTGKTFSRLRRAWAEWNTTWSNRKAAGFRNWIQPGSVLQSLEFNIRVNPIHELRWRLFPSGKSFFLWICAFLPWEFPAPGGTSANRKAMRAFAAPLGARKNSGED